MKSGTVPLPEPLPPCHDRNRFWERFREFSLEAVLKSEPVNIFGAVLEAVPVCKKIEPVPKNILPVLVWNRFWERFLLRNRFFMQFKIRNIFPSPILFVRSSGAVLSLAEVSVLISAWISVKLRMSVSNYPYNHGYPQ